jgi:predicted component of type VI protein secretion system
MSYRLRYQQHDFELADGEFVIGRSADCQLALDDPLVSRNHAKLMLDSAGVAIEDLGSRNGVRVNGQRIEGSKRLAHGDRILIGNQEIVLLRRREAQNDTIAQMPATHRADAFGLIAGLADKAIALGHGEEAERLLETYLRHVLEDAEALQSVTPEVAERAADYAVKLASLTAKGSWVDYVFALYLALRRPCPAQIVDALYDALRKVKGAERKLLRDYSELLRSNAAALNPTERFLLNRIEGLERLVGLK